MHKSIKIIISDISLKKNSSEIFTLNKQRLIQHKISFWPTV